MLLLEVITRIPLRVAGYCSRPGRWHGRLAKQHELLACEKTCHNRPVTVQLADRRVEEV